MYILRITQKLQNTSRIKPEIQLVSADSDQEWYATMVSSTFKGRNFVMFMHVKTKLTLLIPGNTLKTTMHHFRDRLQQFLLRNGYASFTEEKFIAIDKDPIIQKTESKQMLGRINDHKIVLEDLFYRMKKYEDISLDEVEDFLADYDFWVGEKKDQLANAYDFIGEFLGE